MSRSVGFAVEELSAAPTTPWAQLNTKQSPVTTLATEKLLADGPSWLDSGKTLAAMSLRKQRSPTQVCGDNFDAKAKKAYYGDQYSTSFKQATINLSCLTSDDKTRGRWGCGTPAVAVKFNKSMLSSPNCKIKLTALYDAVVSNHVGLSPAKCSCPEKVPWALCMTLAKQSAMMHVSRKGEAFSVRIRL